MSRNRRKNNDSVRATTFVWWLLLFIGITGFGLFYVSIKNQTLAFAGQRGTFERDLRSLNERNSALAKETEALTARSVLQRKVDSGFIKLVEIDPMLIVRLDPNGVSSSLIAESASSPKILAQK